MTMKGTMTDNVPETAVPVIHPFTGRSVHVRRMMVMKAHHGLEAGQFVYDCSDGKLYLSKTRFIWKRGLTRDFGPALDPEIYRDVLVGVSSNPEEE